MEREPLSSEADALWRRLWEMWQDNDEEDVILDSNKLADLEDEIPGLENRMKTALAYLQRARYIQYRSGVGDDGIEPILYDVYAWGRYIIGRLNNVHNRCRTAKLVQP